MTLLLSLEALTFCFCFSSLEIFCVNCKVITECLEALLYVFSKRGSRISIICFGPSTEFEFSISCTSFVIEEIIFSVVKESEALRSCLDHFSNLLQFNNHCNCFSLFLFVKKLCYFCSENLKRNSLVSHFRFSNI